MNATANTSIVASENGGSMGEGCQKNGSSLLLEKKCHINAKRKYKGRQSYLSIDVMRRMINEILCNNKISRLKLANILGIDTDVLNNLILQKKVSTELMIKINLPLIELYCGTKFENKTSKRWV